MCHIGQIRLPDGRYYSAVCLPRVDGGLTATRRLIRTGTVPVLQQRRNLSLARGKYRIGARISISFVLYGAMDACGARQGPNSRLRFALTDDG